MGRENGTYAQDKHTNNFENFERETQVAAKRKELHARCSDYSKKKYGAQMKKRTQTEAAANKHSGRDKTIYRFIRKQSSYIFLSSFFRAF